ncbi:hypothetical protein LXL04_018266 [Taraxacum kok-saghyz]
MFNLFGVHLFSRDEDISNKTSPFFTDQKFKSRDELVEWTQNTAYSLGYVIVTRRSKAYVNGSVYKVILICDRGREYKATNTIRVSGSKKINCNFQLEGKYSKEYIITGCLRVESQHAKLKRYLKSANLKLDRFVQRIDEIVQSQVTSINLSFENSLIHRYNHHKLKCFKDLRGKVSNEALDIMLGEIQKLNDLTLNSSNCGCQVHNSCGLLCACMLSVYLNSGESISLDLIDIFWKKLDYKPMKVVGNDDIEEPVVRIDDVLEKIKENYNEETEPGK